MNSSDKNSKKFQKLNLIARIIALIVLPIMCVVYFSFASYNVARVYFIPKDGINTQAEVTSLTEGVDCMPGARYSYNWDCYYVTFKYKDLDNDEHIKSERNGNYSYF